MALLQGVVEDGETEEEEEEEAASLWLLLPFFCRSCSNSDSWYMRLMLGEITPDFSLTKSYASESPIPCDRITHAITRLADRDTPSWQCTSTLPPSLAPVVASSIIRNAVGKSRSRLRWWCVHAKL